MLDLLQLTQNPFFSSGLALMILGGTLYQLKRLPGFFYDFIERYFIVRMEILDDDEAYDWMRVWLAERLRGTLSISVHTKRDNRGTVNRYDDDVVETVKRRPNIYFVPAVGTYFFRFQGRFVTLSRNRDEGTAANTLGADGKSLTRSRESFTLRIFSRQKNLARLLVEECRDKAIPADDKIDVLVANYNCWSVGTRITPRPLDSVILDGDQAEQLLADMREFQSSRDWYRDIGVPYRRGYLLFGPPGNGKTSVVKALAGALDLSIYLLMLADRDMNDQRINELLARVPDKSILLLEDIDCAFAKRKQASGKDNGLTFSGLLNAIDGVASAEGRIIMMTTNHIEKLDPALIRPGRADVKLEFGNATAEQGRQLYRRFYPNHAERADDFADRLEDRKFSMATLQDFLMLHRRDPDAAITLAAEIGRLQTNPAKSTPSFSRPRPKPTHSTEFSQRSGHTEQVVP